MQRLRYSVCRVVYGETLEELLKRWHVTGADQCTRLSAAKDLAFQVGTV